MAGRARNMRASPSARRSAASV